MEIAIFGININPLESSGRAAAVDACPSILKDVIEVRIFVFLLNTIKPLFRIHV